MNESEPVTRAGWRLDPAAFSWRFSRSSGPGGQGVNTTDSKAELLCDVERVGLPPEITDRVVTKLGSEVRIAASAHRSQLRNRADALDRLGLMIDLAARLQTRRRPTRPSLGAVERRLVSKKRDSARKADRRWRAEE